MPIAPWPFSEPATDISHAAPNLPGPAGIKLGGHLARFADAEAAKRADAPKRCHDCAFRAGTAPNGCAQTLLDALKCLVEGGPDFDCHIKPGVCAGYALLKEATP